MRLIDADALKAYLQENYIIYDHSLEDIDAQPTIEVALIVPRTEREETDEAD